jgi:hypothetical protein
MFDLFAANYSGAMGYEWLYTSSPNEEHYLWRVMALTHPLNWVPE